MSAYKLVSTALSVLQCLLAVPLAGISIWYFIELKEFTDLRNRDAHLLDFETHWPQIVPWMFLALSILVIFVNACGFHSACSNQKSSLYVYATCISIVTLLAFTAGFLGLTSAASEESDKFITNTVNEAFKEKSFRMALPSRDTAFDDAFMGIERRLRCCAVTGYADYSKDELPNSCCDVNNPIDCEKFARARNGCAEVAKRYSAIFIRYSSIGAIGIALLGVGSVIVAVLMSLSFRKKTERFPSEAESEPLKLPL